MAEGQTILPDPDTIRLQIEPVELGLNPSDRSLLIASLRSALPGAVGIYYYDETRTRKTHVNFDGAKFNLPSASQDFYVSLGGRCDVPYDKYNSATHSFENSVKAVESMLGGYARNGSFRLSSRRTPVPQDGGTPKSSKNGNMKSLLNTLEQRSTPVPEFHEAAHLTHAPLQAPAQPEHVSSEILPKPLTPIEQQFVDLAKISTGKDIIIDSQRNEITQLNEQIKDLKRHLEEKTKVLVETENNLKQREDELNMLKELSSEQTYMNTQLAETEKSLKDLEAVKNKLVEEHKKENQENEAKIAGLEHIKHEHETKILENSNTINHLTNHVNELTDENSKLSDKIKEDLQEATSKFSQYNDLQKEMAADYEEVSMKNMELLREIANLKSELDRRDENYNSTQNDLSLKTLELEKMSLTQKSRIRELSFLVEQLTKENMEGARRYEVMATEKRESERKLDLLKADSRAQRTKSFADRLRF
ncbi:hypothetical protein L596_012861 [Steinernema carpocapsae]|uniref:TAR DNA-binding protein 43 N-terminal domain-containing protein n=1 Tax=Steinernema carpocapsae TaxID=34508 RepID=A0A4U5NZ82_STECR|nr:hypothetical protein L596_012861 [Steinernema carpocapsae]